MFLGSWLISFGYGNGWLSEWLGACLQNTKERFDSATNLKIHDMATKKTVKKPSTKHKKLDKSLHNKNALLAALESSLGVKTTACKKVGISRTMLYNYLEEDEEFAAKVKDIENISLDFVESQLFQQIKQGSTAATIFYLKTKGKNRGYTERKELTGKDGKDLIPPKEGFEVNGEFFEL